MSLVVNKHVGRLHRYLPFSPLHSQIYEEHADPSQMKSIDTKAAQTLLDLVHKPEIRLVVLTGDAGHGKTHLCRRLIQSLTGDNAPAAHATMMRCSHGDAEVATVDGRKLFVITDLSEFADEAPAIDIITAALGADNSVLVVCANEGKLRKLITTGGDGLRSLRIGLERGREQGTVCHAQNLAIIDLNNQSVSSGDNRGIVGALLQQWCLDGRSWRACGDCDAREACPIYSNRELLAADKDPTTGETRRQGIHDLMCIVEQSGATVTIRETLILLALAITGGLDCRDVHARWSKRPTDRTWQWRHTYSQVIFAPDLGHDASKNLRILHDLRRIDPGRRAIRSVDERLAADTDLTDDPFFPGQFAGRTSAPRSRKDARAEADSHKELFRYLRRRDYFDLRGTPDSSHKKTRGERLGFRHYEQFSFALSTATPAQLTGVRDSVLRGLEAIQEVRRGRNVLGNFALVDPAFASAQGKATIIARQMPLREVQLSALSKHWAAAESNELLVVDAVDWLDRHLAIRFMNPQTIIHLNLVQFEFLLRSADGMSCRNFFHADIRRLMTSLSRLTVARDDDEILVSFADKMVKLIVDEGDRIRAQGGLH